MKSRPILFSAPMVRALLDGSKTQTRRIVKPQPPHWQWTNVKEYAEVSGLTFKMPDQDYWIKPCPYGQPGDQLWVRETFTVSSGDTAVYRADARDQRGDRWHSIAPGDPDKEVRWKPSIFMQRKYSRITLEITDVRVQRLQDISEEDAEAEGVAKAGVAFGKTILPSTATGVERYAALWESINGPGLWEANPWVWAITFKRT